MNIKSLILALVPLLAAGCSDEVPYVPVAPVQSDGALSVPYEVDGQMPLARGVATMSHETKLDHVYVMFFDAENSDLFAAYASVNVPAGKNRLSFDPPEELARDHDYRVLAIGNSSAYRSADGKTLEQAIREFSDNYSAAMGQFTVAFDGAVTSDTPGRLPLWGRYVDSSDEETLFRITYDAEDKVTVVNQGRFYFSRAICRVDLHNLVGHILDIRSARVVNGRNAAYVFSDGRNAGDITPFEPQTAPDGTGYKPITSDMTPGVNTTQRLEGSLYAFPNIVNTSVVNDKQTTALIIAGYYIENGKKDDYLTYYRFNLANLGESQVLRRNYCYRATVKGVRRRGATDEKTAYNDSSPIFEYDVDEEWGATDDNVVTDKDGNFLVVNKTHLTFQGDAHEADFVELRVSTNPELEWIVEWVDEPGHSNDKFSFEKLSNQAVKCGPLEENHSMYVRYGYCRISAKNTQTGKTLHMPIYLMQLSTVDNVKTLTVNGETGTLRQVLNPMGGTVELQVVTGSAANAWSAEDDGNMLMNWDTQGVSFTGHGSNKTSLVITVPANTTGQTRTACIIVSLDDNETAEDGSKRVPDVMIELSQETSPQLLDVINMPTNGPLDIQCFSTETGNQNGVVNPRNFIVKLTDPRYRYKVTSTFNKSRDLVLSPDAHRGIGSASPAYAVQSAASAGSDELTDLQNGTQFWINPFRTGPNDPRITGTITVTAYNPDDPTAPTEERSFTVRLISEPVEINDVILTNGTNSYLLADRNFGAPSRISADGTEVPAAYYDYRDYVEVTNGRKPVDNSSFSGILTKYDIHTGSIPGWTLPYTDDSLIKLWLEDNIRVNPFYAKDRASDWNLLNSDIMSMIDTRIMVSKERKFVVSDYLTTTGRKVCCWIPNVLGKANLYDLYFEGCLYRNKYYAAGGPGDWNLEIVAFSLGISNYSFSIVSKGIFGTSSSLSAQNSMPARLFMTLSPDDMNDCLDIYRLGSLR